MDPEHGRTRRALQMSVRCPCQQRLEFRDRALGGGGGASGTEPVASAARRSSIKLSNRNIVQIAAGDRPRSTPFSSKTSCW
jgi:hypothetical protein